LTLEVTAQPDVALEIKQDGKLVGQAVWGMASPIDPGPHTIEASAPGKKPWSETVSITASERQHRVVVPVLLDAPPEKLAVVMAPPPPVAQPAEPRVVSSTQKTVGWVLLGVGSAAIVTGGVLALLARGDDSDAAAQCRPDRVTLCSPAGVELGKSARSKATWAGVSAGAGLLALGAGVTLLLTAPTSDATADIALAATASADGGRLSLTAIW
jgi:hypothetical protein